MPIYYNFILDGGRSNQQISLVNTDTTAVVVESIEITTNANIQSPWQTFGNQWSNVTVVQDGNLYTYTLPLNPAVSIPAGTTAVLEYSISTALGPFANVAMPPQQVQLQIQGETGYQNISLYNPNPQSNPNPTMRCSVYHAEWGEYDYKQDMTTEAINALNGLSYAFGGFNAGDNSNTSNVFSLDTWADQEELPLLALQQQRLPYLTSTISFGGWTNNGEMMAPVFSQMTADPMALKNFLTNSVAAVQQLGVNGIGIDWEYPASVQDAANYVSLLQELRNALPQGSRLIIAAPAGIDKIQVFTAAQWQQIASLVDDIQVMSYDYFGAFSTTADFLSAWQLSPSSPYYSDPVNGYYCAQKTFALYQSMNVPSNKLSIGIPNYTRAMIVADAGNYAGLYQPVIGTPQGDFAGSNGVYGWNSIQNTLNNQSSPLDELGVTTWNYYDSTNALCTAAGMCVLSGQMSNGQWVVMTFLDPTSAALRAQQAMQLNLGGTMMWANYFESTNSNNKIIDAVSNALNNPTATLAKQDFNLSADALKKAVPTKIITRPAELALKKPVIQYGVQPYESVHKIKTGGFAPAPQVNHATQPAPQFPKIETAIPSLFFAAPTQSKKQAETSFSETLNGLCEDAAGIAETVIDGFKYFCCM